MYPILNLGIFQIQTYFVIMITLFVISLFWVFRRSVKYNLPKSLVLDLTFVLATSGFLFARLFHVFFENPSFYFNHPGEIFLFWNGGFVFLGGFIGALLTGVVFVHVIHKGALMRNLMDFFAPLISFNYAVGRLGCLMAGCCFGKYCERPWAIAGRHPTQLYAFLWDLVLFLILIIAENWLQKIKTLQQGTLFTLWLMGHGVGRFFIEFYRDDFRGPIYLLSISGWISLAMTLGGGIFYLKLNTQLLSRRGRS